MMAAANQNNPADVAWSECEGAATYLLFREHERAETLAARALELSEKHRIALVAEQARCYLGLARARLGRPSEGVGLVRRGIAGRAAIRITTTPSPCIWQSPRRYRVPLATRLKGSDNSCSQIILTPARYYSLRSFACVASWKRSMGGAKQSKQTSSKHSRWRAVWARKCSSCVQL